ncbi:BamA/TamA family outer membrane protein [Saccharicrinis aurantiacus]|uniref:BamA/TamA family outer membrane protein n=1 Tax=Saccharicrinis aurantiacus TaxID=1849719 RepID=UPI00094FCD9A|nr:BamA/TamA family outer membrane protein [Saccharicrinis aurantiacus]
MFKHCFFSIIAIMTFSRIHILRYIKGELKYIYLFLSICIYTVSTAQIPQSIQQTYNALDSLVTDAIQKDVGILPAPTFNPSFGTGIAIVPVVIYKLPGLSEETHPSTIQGLIMVNLRGSLITGIKSTNYLNKNKFWFDGYVGYMNVHLDPENSQYSKLHFRGFSSSFSGLYSIVPDFYFGPIVNANYLSEFGSESDESEKVNYNWYVTPGLKVSFDTRDDIYFPTKAWFLEGTVQGLVELDDNIEAYQKITIGLTNYFPINTPKPIIFANRIYSQIGFGEMPLHEKASPGGSAILRGYVSGRYMDNSIVTYQSEMRWMFSKRWGVVAFGGVGLLFDQVWHINNANFLPSIGTGVRFKMFKKLKINAALDLAMGRENSNVYFRLSEAF